MSPFPCVVLSCVDPVTGLFPAQAVLLKCLQEASWFRGVVANKPFENVEKFKYFRTTVTDQNPIHEQIKRRLNSGNDCYHSVLRLSASSNLCKSLKIKI
jgi:hypothetical protein